MFNRLMITAATVALIAGTGFANAQGTGMGREGSPAGSAAQQARARHRRSTAETRQPRQIVTRRNRPGLRA